MNAVLPFPSLPPALVAKYALGAPALRVFGIAEDDLALDFTDGDAPSLVTRILAQCAFDGARPLPAELFGELTVGKRLECLLHLAAGGGRTAFSFTFRCAACREELEIELTLAELAALQTAADAAETVEIELAAGRAVFRKPCGRDQESWRGAAFADERAAARAMVAALWLAPTGVPELDETELERLAAALDAADPLIDFTCRARCGECGTAADYPIDLFEFALGELRRAQLFLLRAVHRLAARYHWSEAEIFAVPHWRRLKYLALIAEEGKR